MVKRLTLRGYNEKVYYAESTGNADKIFKLELHPSKIGEIIKKPIFEISGSSIAVMLIDSKNMQDDSTNDNVRQAFYIMDDNQKIYRIFNEDGIKFVTDREIDFGLHHNRLKEVTRLKN